MARKNGTVGIQPHSSEKVTFVESIVQRRASPGILMFSDKLQLLYLNREAMHFNERLARATSSSVSHGLFSPIVYQMCSEIAECLKTKANVKEWEHFQIVKLPPTVPPMIMRGIGIPTSRTLLILMEGLSDRHRKEVKLNGHHQLTERERTVVECLACGMTNKQIAQRLRLSEHTVKDHLKHVMQKTETHTRTELLMNVGAYSLREHESKAHA